MAFADVNARIKPVRVSRNGNARTLVVPVEAAEAAHIEPGQLFSLEVAEDALVYRRVGASGGHFVGAGADRIYVAARRSGIPIDSDPSPAPPLDWDF